MEGWGALGRGSAGPALGGQISQAIKQDVWAFSCRHEHRHQLFKHVPSRYPNVGDEAVAQLLQSGSGIGGQGHVLHWHNIYYIYNYYMQYILCIINQGSPWLWYIAHLDLCMWSIAIWHECPGASYIVHQFGG